MNPEIQPKYDDIVVRKFEEIAVPEAYELRGDLEMAVEDVLTSVEASNPFTRTAFVEAVLVAGKQWDDPVQVTSPLQLESTRPIPQAVTEAVLCLDSLQSQYRIIREEHIEPEDTRQQLLDATREFLPAINKSRLDDLPTERSYVALGIARETLDELTKSQLVGYSDYQLGIMKYRFMEAVRAFDHQGLLDPVIPVAEFDCFKRVHYLLETYDVWPQLPHGFPDDEDIDIIDEKIIKSEYNTPNPGQSLYQHFRDLAIRQRQQDFAKYRTLLASGPRNIELLDEKTAINRLAVKGQPPEQFSTARLLERVPSTIVAACKTLTFRQFEAEEEKVYDKTGELYGYVGGSCDRRRNIEINTKRINQTNLWPVLTHEFGHILTQIIHTGDLGDFDKVRRREKVAITAYVDFNNRNRPEEAASEDLAESFAIYLTKPEELRTVAPKRYRVLKQILANY